MRNLLTVIVALSLILSVWLCSAGHAQPAPLSKAELRARVEAEFTQSMQNTPADPRLQEQLGGLAAAVFRVGRQITVGALAQALPVDWLVHFEVVWPLTDAGLVPSYVSGVKPVPSSFDSVVVLLRYGIDDNPKNDMSSDDLVRDLDAIRLSGPLFERKKGDANEPSVLYVRDFSSKLRDTTATVVIRCKVREQQTGRIYELAASEEWQFRPTADKQQRCWKRIDTRHFLFPEDENRDRSADGKAMPKKAEPVKIAYPYEMDSATRRTFLDKVKTLRRGDSYDRIVQLLGQPSNQYANSAMEHDRPLGVCLTYHAKRLGDGVNLKYDAYLLVDLDNNQKLVWMAEHNLPEIAEYVSAQNGNKSNRDNENNSSNGLTRRKKENKAKRSATDEHGRGK